MNLFLFSWYLLVYLVCMFNYLNLYAWLHVLYFYIVDFKSSIELVLYVCYVSTLNKTLNWIELKDVEFTIQLLLLWWEVRVIEKHFLSTTNHTTGFKRIKSCTSKTYGWQWHKSCKWGVNYFIVNMRHTKCEYYQKVNSQVINFLHLLLLISVENQFSYCVTWWGIVPSSLVQALYLTKQHYRRTVPSGEDNNRILVVSKTRVATSVFKYRLVICSSYRQINWS